LHHNPVMAARYRYLTTRQHNRLTDGQARAAIAAALLRWIHVVVTQRVRWDAAIASATSEMLIAA
jgi:transposase